MGTSTKKLWSFLSIYLKHFGHKTIYLEMFLKLLKLMNAWLYLFISSNVEYNGNDKLNIFFNEIGFQTAGRPMLKDVKLGLIANLLCFAIFEHQILSPLKSIFIKSGYNFLIHVSGSFSADEKNGHASIDLRKTFVELPFHFIEMKKLKHLYRCIHYHTTCQNR